MSDRGDRDGPAEAVDGEETDAIRPVAGHLPGLAPEPERLDLDAVEEDLDAVDRALDRLADGTYGTDEVTGEPIPDDVLENDPTARRT